MGFASTCAAAVVAAAALHTAVAQCDDEYQCEFKSPTGSYYDLSPLCKGGSQYTVTDANNANATYSFNVCGYAQDSCLPYGYNPEYQKGVAMQFFGDPAPVGENCTDKFTGQPVQCTKDCYILGVGTPVITLFDASQPTQGVNITHYSVPSVINDPFACPNDQTGTTISRRITISVLCDANADVPYITWAGEYSRCIYGVKMFSKYGCGCRPSCINKNCGPSGCPIGLDGTIGFCGAPFMYGTCPYGQTCSPTGQCCTPDCRGRNCGPDGCGGTCGDLNGDCAQGYTCSKYQQCAPANVPPSPQASLLPTVKITTTTSGQYGAAFIGGVMASGAIALGVSFFLKARAAMAGYSAV